MRSKPLAQLELHNRKRNVLMTADALGGVWTYALELVRALEPHGVTVHLATMGDRLTPTQRDEANAIANLTVQESAFRLEWMNDPWDDVRQAGEWLLELERDLVPDVVHLNGYAHGNLPFVAPKLVVGHSCVASWQQAVWGGPLWAEWSTYRDAVVSGLRAADVVVAPSQAMLSALEWHYGPLPASRVIYNGRDPALFAPCGKEPFILSAGRLWDEAKNVGMLAWAAEDLPWPVCVAGDTHSPEGNEAGTGAARFLGRLAPPVLADWLARAAIYALPARYEPFGLSILEAALSGCALVLGDIASLREIWGDAALFVPPNDGDALRDALQTLIADPSLRADLSERAQLRARHFTPERMAEAYLGLYAELEKQQAAGVPPPHATTSHIL